MRKKKNEEEEDVWIMTKDTTKKIQEA